VVVVVVVVVCTMRASKAAAQRYIIQSNASRELWDADVHESRGKPSEIAKNSIRAEAGNRLTAGIKTWTPTARYQEKEKKKKRSDKTCWAITANYRS
jgi:hypothetical protein